MAVVACGAIATHISNIASRENFDVTIYPLPPLLHNHPEKIAGEVDAKIEEIKDKYSKIAVAYADCGSYGALDKVLEKHGISRLGGDHCYDVFAGRQKVMELTTTGTYFFTDYLVKSFHRSVVVELGLDRHPELIDDYFKNYSKVVLQSPAGHKTGHPFSLFAQNVRSQNTMSTCIICASAKNRNHSPQ